jgi:hypothetical protein
VVHTEVDRVMYHVWPDKVTIDCWRNEDLQNVLHPAWQNMVDSIPDDLYHSEYEQAIDRIMRKYKAKMIRPTTYPHYMRFPNEKMAMWFLLEWM